MLGVKDPSPASKAWAKFPVTVGAGGDALAAGGGTGTGAASAMGWCSDEVLQGGGAVLALAIGCSKLGGGAVLAVGAGAVLAVAIGCSEATGALGGGAVLAVAIGCSKATGALGGGAVLAVAIGCAEAAGHVREGWLMQDAPHHPPVPHLSHFLTCFPAPPLAPKVVPQPPAPKLLAPHQSPHHHRLQPHQELKMEALKRPESTTHPGPVMTDAYKYKYICTYTYTYLKNIYIYTHICIYIYICT